MSIRQQRQSLIHVYTTTKTVSHDNTDVMFTAQQRQSMIHVYTITKTVTHDNTDVMFTAQQRQTARHVYTVTDDICGCSPSDVVFVMTKLRDKVTLLASIMHAYGSRRVAIVHPYPHRSPPSSSHSSSHSSSSNHSMDMEEDWPIHTGYLNVTLAQVACETHRPQLEQWLHLFSPSAQPQSDEEHFYVNTMNTAIQAKLALLE